jgi:hypothetical protein
MQNNYRGNPPFKGLVQGVCLFVHINFMMAMLVFFNVVIFIESSTSAPRGLQLRRTADKMRAPPLRVQQNVEFSV